MKRIATVLLVLVVIFLAGCGSGNHNVLMPVKKSTKGAVAFNIDLESLQQNAQPAKAQLSSSLSPTSTIITAVTVTLSRAGYTDVGHDLPVVNNVASGVVNGLEQGYWHITAVVYSDLTLIYTGSIDVNIIANAQVTAEILFDPADASPPSGSTGSVLVTVGLNKYPGYSKINQFVSKVLQDPVQGKIYIFDSSTSILAVYNADTMVREKDITLAEAPQALAVEPAGGSVLLGFSSGKIYRLNITDESLTLVGDSLVSVTAIVPLSSTFSLVASAVGWGSSNVYKTINVDNGQTVSNITNYFYALSNFVFNPDAGAIYALDSGISPADMHHMVVSAATGSIVSISDSRYHGDYSFGAPIRIINNGTRIAAASGNMFVSSSLAADDITYAGNLGHPFIDLVSDDALGNLYMLNSDSVQKLLVIDQGSFFTTMTIDLIAGPKLLFNTPDNIIVFVKPDNDYYVKVFSKTALGLM